MRAVFTFAVAALTLCSGLTAQEALVPDCDIHHIALDLRFDWKSKQAHGAAALFLSLAEPSDHITLDAAKLSIKAVTDGSGEALEFEYEGDEADDSLVIQLGRTALPEEILEIHVSYRTNHINRSDPNNLWGSFGKGIRFQQPTSTTPNKRRQVWTAGGPAANRYWFPGNDSPGDLRTTEFTATVASKLTVVSNGALQSLKENADGTRTFHFKADTPYPNHLTSFAIGEFVPVRQGWDGIEIVTYGYPDEVEAVEATVERLPEMMEFFSEKTGARYPHSTYTQVVVQDHPFPGRVGQHMAPIMSDNMIDDFRTHADFLYIWDDVEAQALASQWFGNLIATAEFEHVWLSLGFSRYFSGLFNSHVNGEQEFLSYPVANALSTTLGDWSLGNRRPIVTSGLEDLDQYTDDNFAATRGALVLRMLHQQLGDDAWWRVVRQYVEANSSKSVTTTDLAQAVMDVTGDPLAWFFDQWVYGMGHPVFEVSQRFSEPDSTISLTLRQTQQRDSSSSYPQAEFFQGRMEIALDDVVEVVHLLPRAENTFTFVVPEKPKLVKIDSRDAWIKEVVFPKTPEALIYQLRQAEDVLGQSSAMTELVAVAQGGDCSSDTRSAIHGALLETIRGDSYWRIRWFAVSQLQWLLQPSNGVEPIELDEATVAALMIAVHSDSAWLRAAAIRLLGESYDKKFAETYLEALADDSDRVINAAATALGGTGISSAYEVLVNLKDKPSWKSQSLISTLNGLRELGDPRGYAVALEALSNTRLPRWWLAVPTWDYPIAAVQTIVALGKGEEVFPLVLRRFRQSLKDNDYNDIFSNLLLIADLGDARGQQAFSLLKAKFASDSNAMAAIQRFEARFKTAIEARAQEK